jgi:hypothetical protein
MTTAMDPSSTDGPDDPQVTRQLEAAESRLLAHYRDRDGITEEHIRRTFDKVGSRFANAHVRTFLPILIERATRLELDRRPAPA